MIKVPFYQQPDQKDCGPTCLRMVSKFYGRSLELETVRNLCETSREGTSLHFLAQAAEQIGFRSLGVKINFHDLEQKAPLPAILHWEGNHFVVVEAIKKGKVYLADPAKGRYPISLAEFLQAWIGPGATPETEEGIALLLEPGTKLTPQDQSSIDNKETGYNFLKPYLKPHHKFIRQVFYGLIGASLLQLVFPFLTQSIVDIGIQNQNLDFVYLILLAQLFLFLGRISIELIRSWLLLQISTRMNIALLSDFFIKLMSLPIRFFDTRLSGDLLQRIQDHYRVEELLTVNSLSSLFSLVNLIIFGGILAFYDLNIFLIFSGGAIIYFAWILLFLRQRKSLDHARFKVLSEEQSKEIELINGMQEIKLHNAEQSKRWTWEFIQSRLFHLSVRGLKLEQKMKLGSEFINELKNILIIFLAAKLVIQGEISLGMMLAISYINGQLNGPLLQLVNFIYAAQDAKLALERMMEIHHKEDEEPRTLERNTHIPEEGDFIFKEYSFRYQGELTPVIKDLNLRIPRHKTTAIVGSSGSGKTTLIKLLLKFYEGQSGTLNLGTLALENLSHRSWREQCGTVMQEGFIFNDTIARNIAVGEDAPSYPKIVEACKMACIQDFVEGLPLSYNTEIGEQGLNMSTGQKQRLLIARAIYKNPKFLFFDEATSALDAQNERQIMENLQRFFKGRTAIVVAHRLSTVKNADLIVVLESGRIIEQGQHDFLVAQKGRYYELIKNQLELGQ